MNKIVFIIIQFIIIVKGIDCTIKDSNCYGIHYTEYGSIVSCSVPKTIAITFDDGPSQYTTYISQKFREYGARATFFTSGKHFGGHRQTMLQVISDGHQIACHTYAHNDLTKLSKNSIILDLEKYEYEFNNLHILPTDVVPRYIRAPFSRMNKEVFSILTTMNYTVIDWTVDGDDTVSGDTMRVYKKQLGGENGTNIDTDKLSIITIQHDTTYASFITIDELLKWLNNTFVSKGVRLVTVAECLNETNAYKQYDISKNKENFTRKFIPLIIITSYIILTSIILAITFFIYLCK